MHYSSIRSRAGLVALVFALIISLVSAVPIPATGSELSSSSPRNPSLNGQDIQLDHSPKISTFRPASRVVTHRQHISINMDDQLVRRSIGSKIKHAFQKVGSAIKHGFQKAGAAIKNVAQKVGSGIKNVAQKVGSGVKHVAQKVGSSIKHVAQKVGSGIKHVAQKVGNGVRTAAKKVGHFIKTTGAKVAKFGLKVVQSVGEAVGTVASFIPEVGKPIQQAIHGVSKVAGVISDHIHAKLSSKLQKGMNVMNKADKIMSYIPRRREFSEEEAFQERDFNEGYYFEERDDVALEDREESYFEFDERDIYERYYDLDDD